MPFSSYKWCLSLTCFLRGASGCLIVFYTTEICVSTNSSLKVRCPWRSLMSFPWCMNQIARVLRSYMACPRWHGLIVQQKQTNKKTWNYKSQWSATSLSRKCWPVWKLESTNIWCLFKVMYVHCKEQYLELKEEQREHHRSPPDLSLPWSSLLNHSTGDEMASLGGTLGASHATGTML